MRVRTIDSSQDVSDASQEGVNTDVLVQDLEQVLACASSLSWHTTCFWTDSDGVRIDLWVNLFVLTALTLGKRVHLLLIHVLRWIILDNSQDARQVHKLKSLCRPDIDFTTPFTQLRRLSIVWQVEDVELLLYGVDLPDVLKLLQQGEEDLLVKQVPHIELI